MTPQEALELLNNMEFAEKYQGKQEYADMLLLCKEALEKQIPKKPITYSSLPQHRCSTCKCAIRVYSNDPYNKFCYHCGQALDWSNN